MPGIKPASSWILVGFVSAAPHWELQEFSFLSLVVVIHYSTSHQPRVTPSYLPCQIVHLIRWSCLSHPSTCLLLLTFKLMLFSSVEKSIFLSKSPAQMFSYSLNSLFSTLRALLQVHLKHDALFVQPALFPGQHLLYPSFTPASIY